MVFLSIWYKGLLPEFWLRGLLFGSGAFLRILVEGLLFCWGPFPKKLLSETFFG